MSRNGSCKSDAGFTLIEVLVALAVIAIVLPAIGSVIAGTVRGSRSTEDRLVVTGIAGSLLSGLTDRTTIQAGTRTGETAGNRWRIDITPMPQPAVEDAAPPRWSPYAIAIRVETRRGYRIQVNTVRLASIAN